MRKLKEAAAPLKAYQLLERTRADGFTAPMTVYRALRGLTDRGLVTKIARLNAFVAVIDTRREEVDVYHICKLCGRADALRIERAAFIALLGAAAMSVEDIFIEVFGICPACAGTPTLQRDA